MGTDRRVVLLSERNVLGKSEDLRKKIEAMNRGPMPPDGWARPSVEELRKKVEKLRKKTASSPAKRPTPVEPAPEVPLSPIAFKRDLPRREPKPKDSVSNRSGAPVLLDKAVSGSEVQAPDGGSAYLVEQRLADGDEVWLALCEQFRDALIDGNSRLRRLIGTEGHAGIWVPENVLFLDLETTGLASTPLFLIGAMTWDDGSLVVRQYFARNYAEERATLSLFRNEASLRKALISFNGKSFDIPYLRARAAACGLPLRLDHQHLDLLHVCRRAWRDVLPDCRLQTLESRICGRPRHGDIPGHEIPDAYHEFVRTGDAAAMVQVLEHNMLDLITLAELMTKLPAE